MRPVPMNATRMASLLLSRNVSYITSGCWRSGPRAVRCPCRKDRPHAQPTPPEHLVNAEGQPYFLWDSEMTLEQFRAGLRDPDPEVRAYLAGKLMRQAKPDDVFTFLTAREIRQLWPRLERYPGKTRELWTWLFETWEANGHVWR